MQYDLVFEGGGAKGMVFVGALEVFTEHGHTPGRLLGTSAGAITATLVAAGYAPAEMLEAMGEKEEGRSVFAGFMGLPTGFDEKSTQASATRDFLRKFDLPLLPAGLEEKLDDALATWLMTQPNLRQIFSLIENGGLYVADRFLIWLERRLDTGTLRGQPRQFSALTFKQFAEATQSNLSLVASDVTGKMILVLNAQTAPDLPVKWAVRMSMSVPLLWEEVVWKTEWGKYNGQDITGHVIVDGGLLSNFPIELLVSRAPQITALMGAPTSADVLGLLIDESTAVNGAEASPALSPTGAALIELRSVQRLLNLVNTMLSAHDKMVIEAFESRVVRLPAKGFGTVEFDMTDERRALLVEAGRAAARTYFDKQSAEAVSFSAGETPDDPQVQQAADRRALKMFNF